MAARPRKTLPAKRERIVAPPSTHEKPQELRIAVLGGKHSGKTSLVSKFYQQCGTVYDGARDFTVDGQRHRMSILDTAGQDDFACLRPAWISGRDCLLFMFDITSRASLDQLEPLHQLHLLLNLRENRQVPVILMANKQDLVKDDASRQAVSREEGKERARRWGAQYIEASALHDDRSEIAEIFEGTARLALAYKTEPPAPTKEKRCAVM